MKIPKEALEEIIACVDEFARSGAFNEMFKTACVCGELPDKSSFLQSLGTIETLRRSTFVKIIGYGVTDPEFPERALNVLEVVRGSAKAREYHEAIKADLEKQRAEQEKIAAVWYKKQLERREVCTPREPKEETMSREEELKWIAEKKQALLQRKKSLLSSMVT